MSAFDARQTLELVNRHGADFLLLVPSMMHEITAADVVTFDTARALRVSGV